MTADTPSPTTGPPVNLHQSEFIVSETWLDSFGHVNNARYLEIFEQARWNWLAAYGLDIGHIRRTSIGPVILEVHLTFCKELLPRQRIRIDSWSEPGQRKTFAIYQALRLLPDESLASELSIVAGMMDMQARKLIAPPPEWEACFTPLTPERA